MPYKAILEALRALVNRLLARDPDQRAALAARVADRVGPGLDELMGLLPELGLLVGDRPAPVRLDPGEREERFQLAIRHLFEALASPDAPAILFLDDVQWADSASFRVMENLLTAFPSGGLTILVAYRANEVGDHHPLRQMTDRLTKAGLSPREMTVAALTQDDICELVGETLSMPPAAVEGLASQLLAKTFGIPFHLRELLTSLHDTGVIAFDRQSMQWRWQDEAIRSRVMDADIAKLMAERLDRLTPEERETLAVASCFGASFTTQMIGIIDPRPKRRVSVSSTGPRRRV